MIVRCSRCEQKNRIPAGRLHEPAKCGKCQAAIAPLAQPIDLQSAADFDELVGQARVPVLIDFWAAWCAPCRMAAPHVKQAAEAMAGRALVAKLDTVRLGDVAMRYRISGIPHFMVTKGGEVVFQQPGLVDGRQMVRWLEDATG